MLTKTSLAYFTTYAYVCYQSYSLLYLLILLEQAVCACLAFIQVFCSFS
jgi:hypothetical protein